MKTTTYIIFIRSNKHPRTINTPMMGRINYTAIRIDGREAMEQKATELVEQGEHISEICTLLGTRIYLPCMR